MSKKNFASSITQINFAPNIDGHSTTLLMANKTDIAIKRIKEFEPPEGYYFADSYGKDSTLTRDLLIKSGAKFQTYHNETGIDPPELVMFGRKHHPEAIIVKPEMSLFKALSTKEGFPTRTTRWCCKMLRERSGKGRIVATGIRWQESPGKRGNRRMFEACTKDKLTWYLNPIIDWTDKEVWEYIHLNNVPYCSLYDERDKQGRLLFKRLGCVLCPMGSPKQTRIQMERWPKLAKAWHRSFQRFYELGWDSVKRWKDAEDMWLWWLSRKGEPKVDSAQCIMFDN